MAVRLTKIWCAAPLMIVLAASAPSACGQDSTPGDGGKVAPAQSDSAQSKEDAQDDDQKEEKTPSSDELMAQAIAAARDDNMDKALELIEQARKVDPENPRPTIILIQALHARGIEFAEAKKTQEAKTYFVKAANVVRELKGDLAEIAAPLADDIFYNEACAYALAGESENAMASLKDSFEHGFDDIDLIHNDADLTSIRDSKEFAELVAKHEKMIAEKFLAETKEQLAGFETYDFNFTLKNLDGEEVKLEDFKGKALIVDFWGTWCPPCRAEIPHFVRLKEQYGDQGLEIIGLTYENEEEEQAIKNVKEFTSDHRVNYPCVIGDDKTQELVPNFEGYPTTLFIDRSGVVRLQLVGAQPHVKLESVVKELLRSTPD